MTDNVITVRFGPDIEKLANEIVASVHDHDQLRTTMARPRGTPCRFACDPETVVRAKALL